VFCLTVLRFSIVGTERKGGAKERRWERVKVKADRREAETDGQADRLAKYSKRSHGKCIAIRLCRHRDLGSDPNSAE
jgi:hypothetical protein